MPAASRRSRPIRRPSISPGHTRRWASAGNSNQSSRLANSSASERIPNELSAFDDEREHRAALFARLELKHAGAADLPCVEVEAVVSVGNRFDGEIRLLGRELILTLQPFVLALPVFRYDGANWPSDVLQSREAAPTMSLSAEPSSATSAIDADCRRSREGKSGHPRDSGNRLIHDDSITAMGKGRTFLPAPCTAG